MDQQKLFGVSPWNNLSKMENIILSISNHAIIREVITCRYRFPLPLTFVWPYIIAKLSSAAVQLQAWCHTVIWCKGTCPNSEICYSGSWGWWCCADHFQLSVSAFGNLLKSFKQTRGNIHAKTPRQLWQRQSRATSRWHELCCGRRACKFFEMQALVI